MNIADRLSLTVCLLSVLGAAACNDSPSGDALHVRYLAPIAAAGSAEPHLALATNGNVVMSWLEPEIDNKATALRVATLDGDDWQTPVTVARGDDWFVNWADFPSVVPISDTLWAAHWLTMTPGGIYSYNVTMSISNDGGTTWSDPLSPHDDGTATEHGFVSLFPWQGAVGAIWLDGRNMSSEGHGGDRANADGGGMTLRSARIGADGSISNAQLVDALVCDCCQTDIARGRSGPIAVYRNRTVDEVRDIHVVRALEGQWQANRPVADDGWKIAACPVNGPAIASLDGRIAVAWFTAANDDTQVRVAWSSDDGKTFTAPVLVDVGRPIGRVDIELLDDGSAIVSWLRTGDNNLGEICLRRVSQSGAPGPVQLVATTGASRASGFPQMLRDGGGLVLAWTDTAGEQSRIVTARVDGSTPAGINARD
jgi:hypothetical protein